MEEATQAVAGTREEVIPAVHIVQDIAEAMADLTVQATEVHTAVHIVLLMAALMGGVIALHTAATDQDTVAIVHHMEVADTVDQVIADHIIVHPLIMAHRQATADLTTAHRRTEDRITPHTQTTTTQQAVNLNPFI